MKFVLSLITIITLSAQDKLIYMDDFYNDEIRSDAFELTSKETVKINVVGPRLNRSSYDYVWILDLKTREPVWVLDDAQSERHDKRHLREYSDEFTLNEGAYKVFYVTGRFHSNFDDGFSIGDLFDWDNYRDSYKRSDLKEFQLTLTANGKRIEDDEAYLEEMYGDRVINYTKARKNEHERIGFELDSDMDIFIYAVGEITRDGNYDTSWIKSLETGKKVWELNRYSAEHAGGGRKNQFFKEKVSLDKGKYILTFVSDDSHHYKNWNTMPPYDPDAWGVSVYVKDKSDFSTFSYDSKTEEKNIIAELTRVRDDEYVSKGFTLEKDMDIRVYALGEGYHRDDLVDYGWIVNAKNRRTVWEMNNRRTEHAGGSSKNRMIDEIIHLEKGSYIVYYKTDDSHSYRDWNASRPYDEEKWGITLYTVDPDDLSEVADYVKDKDSDVLASIDRAQDNMYESETFSLDEDTEVRVYALGEGMNREMYDYGWIKDADTGKRVWEMYYEDTEHAGGARKNRVVDDVIRLKKGKYRVYYKTDDSHSFRDWNSNPPHDQEHWGITLYIHKD